LTSTLTSEEALGRFVLALEPLAPAVPGDQTVAGRTFALTDDGRGIATAMAGLLAARGAQARVVAMGESVGRVDGLIHLAALAESPADGQSKLMFELAKDAVADGAAWVLAATAMGGAFGLSDGAHSGRLACFGVGGLLKSIAKEHPALRVRAVDLDPTAVPGELAELLLAELLAGDGPVEVGYVGGARHAVRVVPARPDESPLAPLALDELLGEDSVVLITGGARGITARVAVALAQRFRCRLELVGRSPLPAPEGETPEIAACADAAALRRFLLAQGGGTPKQIDATIAAILAGRELRATLAAIEAAGATVAYHAVDVRDRAAFGALIDEVYARHGRIDGVLHGAGVIEDKLLRDKTRDSFDRVFDTKVTGALTLAEKLHRDVKFVVFFSSVSGAFGNRGQSDYAAANDALDKLALHLDRMLPGRVLSINWGPWGGTGMISPELEREYSRRGIGLIQPDEGVTQLLDELRRPGLAQVILMRAEPASMGG
jgi:NAD(P)-dependent dehydrogenase (short-subunit alcohol dehydrogenase family)